MPQVYRLADAVPLLSPAWLFWEFGLDFPPPLAQTEESGAAHLSEARHLLICQFCLVQMDSRVWGGSPVEDPALGKISSALPSINSSDLALIGLCFVTGETNAHKDLVNWEGLINQNAYR